MKFWQKEDYSEFIFGSVCAVCFAFISIFAMLKGHFNQFVVAYMIICVAGMFAANSIGKFLMKLIDVFLRRKEQK